VAFLIREEEEIPDFDLFFSPFFRYENPYVAWLWAVFMPRKRKNNGVKKLNLFLVL